MFYLVIVNTLSGLLMLSSDKKGVSKINLNAAEVLIQRADRSQYGLREVCRALPSTADSSCFALMAGTTKNVFEILQLGEATVLSVAAFERCKSVQHL